ncbi:MAG: hypothetical protein EHM34_04130, partial [Nitrosopumilales archaeon]
MMVVRSDYFIEALSTLPRTNINSIAYKLYHGEVDGGVDFNFLDIEVEDDKILCSFLPLNRKDAKIDKWNSPQRQKAKIGKILKKLYPNHLDTDIEKTVSDLKVALIKTDYTFKFLAGQDLLAAYNRECYAGDATSGTSLGGSCMKHPHANNYMKLYAENPDAVRLLTSWVDDKLVARALFWKGIYKDNA